MKKIKRTFLKPIPIKLATQVKITTNSYYPELAERAKRIQYTYIY